MEKRFQRVGCLVALGLIVAALAFGEFHESNTANDIAAAYRACEGQTGHRCR